MYAFLALLALVAAVGAQVPRPCESPREWNGRMFQVDRSKNVTVLGKLSYDEPNQRVRFIEDVDVSGKRYFFDYIILYGEGLLYQIELSINRTGECKVYKFEEPFRPAEIPPDAKFAVEAYIGSSAGYGEGVLVNTFYGEEEREGQKAYYVATVTEVGCVPVQSVAYSQRTGVIHTSFYDVMLGVDPEHFVPPSDCKPAGKTIKEAPFRL